MSMRPRKHPRFAVELRTAITVDGQTAAAATRDVSHGGICVVAQLPATRGATVQMVVSLALGAGTFSEDLALPARVVWCTPQNDGFQIGAVFEDMAPATVTQLKMFMRFLQQEFLVESDAPRANAGPFDTSTEEAPDG